MPRCAVCVSFEPVIRQVGTYRRALPMLQLLPGHNAAKIGSLIKSVGSKLMIRITHTVGRRKKIVAHIRKGRKIDRKGKR